MPRDEATLIDVIKAAQLASVFVQDVEKEYFLQDLKTQSAVQHQLMIIGESVKRLSREFRNQHAAIP